MPSGSAGSVGGVDPLIELTASLKPQFRANAKWYLSRYGLAHLSKLKDSTGQYLWEPSKKAGVPSMLLGYPVVEVEQMPSVAANAYPIAFGDMRRAYLRVARPGIKFLPDPYTAKPNVLLYSYARRGGDVANFQALKLLKIATS